MGRLAILSVGGAVGTGAATAVAAMLADMWWLKAWDGPNSMVGVK